MSWLRNKKDKKDGSLWRKGAVEGAGNQTES